MEQAEAAQRAEPIMEPHAAVRPARPIRAITAMPARARVEQLQPKPVRLRHQPVVTVRPEQARKGPARAEPQRHPILRLPDKPTAHQLRTIHRPVRRVRQVRPALPIRPRRARAAPAAPAVPAVHAAAAEVAATVVEAAAVLLAEVAGNQKHRSL